MRAIIVAAVTLVAVAGLGGCDNPNLPWNNKGITGTFSPNSFKGTVKAEFLAPSKPSDSHRDMRLLEDFGFVDGKGLSWDVPKGYVTNGASIPWGLWNIIGGPYDGPYRDAAVVHDYYSEKKLRTWEATHLMYYEASLARGVSDTLARTMYGGLLLGGPRWELAPQPAAKKADLSGGLLAQTTPPPASPPIVTKVDPGLVSPTERQKQAFEELQRWIVASKPSPAEIAKRVEEMRKTLGLPSMPPKAP